MAKRRKRTSASIRKRAAAKRYLAYLKGEERRKSALFAERMRGGAPAPKSGKAEIREIKERLAKRPLPPVLYWLFKSVNQAPDPKALPPQSDIEATLAMALQQKTEDVLTRSFGRRG